MKTGIEYFSSLAVPEELPERPQAILHRFPRSELGLCSQEIVVLVSMVGPNVPEVSDVLPIAELAEVPKSSPVGPDGPWQNSPWIRFKVEVQHFVWVDFARKDCSFVKGSGDFWIVTFFPNILQGGLLSARL